MKGEIKPLYGIVVMIVFTVILAGAIYIYVEKGQKESKQENTYTIGSILHVVVNDRDIVCLKGFDTDNTRGYIIGKLVGFSEEVEINFNEGVAYAYGDENLTEKVLSINYFDPENNIFVYLCANRKCCNSWRRSINTYTRRKIRSSINRIFRSSKSGCISCYC